ncbi:MAG: hypothetical protein ISP01_05275 [Methanobrevibacter arboriphilus]|uniref:Transmembrane protein n=1 Tax=Methanobrevibacter arboriphilus TaxID=39441 RepID=A0A843AND1_METAZ|nr:hypothetical protein [Methanobrevibacter arboriphilus]MBF4468799.1 hypothetical protein [Methanobrevibacter arboriphilus]
MNIGANLAMWCCCPPCILIVFVKILVSVFSYSNNNSLASIVLNKLT